MSAIRTVRQHKAIIANYEIWEEEYGRDYSAERARHEECIAIIRALNIRAREKRKARNSTPTAQLQIGIDTVTKQLAQCDKTRAYYKKHHAVNPNHYSRLEFALELRIKALENEQSALRARLRTAKTANKTKTTEKAEKAQAKMETSEWKCT